MTDTDVLSSAFGWVSIACWIVVYVPQIYENYVLKSGEGLSVLFIAIWLLGDIFNIIGALMAHLLPTVVILAVYYMGCDIVALSQVYYYRWYYPVNKTHDEAGEGSPLLPEQERKMPETTMKRKIANYVLASVFVVVVGLAAWWLDPGKGDETSGDGKDEVVLEWKSQVIGWASAILYLGARIPQIIKNYKTKCEGLAPALFFFCILGNATYAVSIIVTIRAWRDFVANASWLAGSVLTIFLDLFVLGQFAYYRRAQLVGEDSEDNER